MINGLTAILRHPRSVLTMLAVLLLAGLISYLTVPKEANPDIDVPVFYVSIIQQGISPEDAERLLVRPMETELRGLDGLKEITGVASEGHAGIVLEFNIDFDKDAALADVRAKVDLAGAKLPSDAEEPQIFETNFSLVPTIIVTLSGNVPERSLYNLARSLKDEIEAIPTVLEANLSGHREELLEVLIDSTRLESYNISQEELIRSLNNNNRLVPAGAIDLGNGRFNVKVPGLLENAQEVYSIPVKVSGDSVVTLGDVAEIRRTFKDPSTFTRVNGQPAIAVEVVKRLGTNVIENNAAVRAAVEKFTAEWPDTVHVGFTLDQSTFIYEVLGSLQSSIMTAIALVMIVVMAALSLRSALLVGFAIPTSFMIGFLIVGLAGMTVNMMVMFGLVLTVGMLVDGAIVIIEYADRKMAEGMHRREAYILAAQRMFWPIVSSTATTLAAFLPMLLWPGVPGEFMSYLPIMVIIVLSASLLTAMVFLPVMGTLFGKSEARAEDAEEARKLAAGSKVDFDEIRGLRGVYIRSLRWLMYRPGIVMATAAAVVVGVFTLYAEHGNGVEFFVDEEPSQAVVLVSARGNLSATDMRDYVRQVEDEVLQVTGIKTVFFNSGVATGGVKLGDVQDKPADMIGSMSIEFEDYCCRRTAAEIFSEIRQRTADIPGIHVEVRKIEGGPPTGKDIRLEIRGPNYAVVDTATARIRRHFDEEVAGLLDVEDTRALPGIEWQIRVDRTEAGRFGADIATVGSMFQLVTEGVLIGKYRPDDSDDEVDIRARLPKSERTLERLDELRVRTPSGLVPVGNFVERTAKQKVSSITRKDGQLTMTVKANVGPDVLVDDKVGEIDAWLKQQQWPNTLQFRFRGADEEQKESGEFLGKAAAAALFLMFIILVTQFNSFYQTVLTLSTVLLAMVGVLIGMMVTGQRFSIIMTGTGIVALAGIVVNNAIVLLDTYNRLHADGLDPVEAMLRTCVQRLRPIFLTTATTIMGLIPMATQVNFDFFTPAIKVGGITSMWWVQLSTAIIFGLAFSTLLTLVLVPVMVAAPTVYRERWQRLRQRVARWRGGSPAPAEAGAGKPRKAANDTYPNREAAE
ncbi:MAG: efflux RND transporter permease subunit [Flavobacteriaceae bacterium]